MRAALIALLAALSLLSHSLRACAGTIYVSTGGLNTILEINSNGSHSTFATASSGLNYPVGLAFDNNGNLFVANSGGGNGNSTIEEFSPNGVGTTFASAGLSYPVALAFGGAGNLFVANDGNNTIEEYSSNATGTIFATATSGLEYPAGVAFDSSGNLYVPNYDNTILKFGTNGDVSVFATNGLDNPAGLAWSGGSLYVANFGNNTIEKFNALGQGSIFSSTNLLSLPDGLAVDSSGNLFVANHGNNEVLEFDSNGVGTVFASGLDNAVGIAIEEIPEPSGILLVSLALPILFLSRLAASLRRDARSRHRHP
jgi:sugar lactone lactonase YvrE